MNVKRITFLALFIALSAVGAFIKIPASAVGSLALDSFPALLAAVLLGPVSGGITAALGHYISALLSGMPLGPLHYIIMVEMFILTWLFGKLYQRELKKSAMVFFFIGNGFVASVPFIFIISSAFYIVNLPSMIAATVLNLLIAALLLPKLVPAAERMIPKGLTK